MFSQTETTDRKSRKRPSAGDAPPAKCSRLEETHVHNIDVRDPHLSDESQRLLYLLFNSSLADKKYFPCNVEFKISEQESVILSHSIFIRPSRKTRDGVRYQVIDSLIGRGGYGAIYDAPVSFALDSNNETVKRKAKARVAKVQSYTDDDSAPNFEGSIDREFDTTSAIMHKLTAVKVEVDSPQTLFPDAAHMVASRSSKHIHCMFMPRFKGSVLAKYVNDGSLSYQERLSIVCEVLKHLAHAHKAEVVHLDVNPSNIMYDRDSGVVEIIDFGIAAWKNSILNVDRGTRSYMAPEVAEASSTPYVANAAADVYSLGVTAERLLRGVEISTRLRKVLNEMQESRSSKRPSIEKIQSAFAKELRDVMNINVKKQPAGACVRQYGFNLAIA